MGEDDLLYRIALTHVPHIGHVHAKILAEQFGDARSIFSARQETLERIEGIGQIRARSIRKFRDFSRAEKEIVFLDKFKIKPLFIKDAEYPKRLLNCYDPPAILYYKGNADLNTSRVAAIVGTRNNTDYGKMATEKLVAALVRFDVLVISGLAFGIDAIAHKSALKNGLSTVGVVGHGLHTIYPPENSGLAREMLANGGLLTEFGKDIKPDKHNFPSRNRVVAGISDVTIIMESGVKGGSMITAEMASGYNRDVFALPGRTIDAKSAGCNELIRNNKAAMYTDPDEFIVQMGWNETGRKKPEAQTQLFPDLTENEQVVINILKESSFTGIDDINLRSGLSASAVAAALLNLELKHVVRSLPGKQYQLIR